MDSNIQSELRVATFILDREKAIEFAINAESVMEATPVSSRIQPLPTGADYLEGFMHLRDDTIPVINLKKFLGLPHSQYPADAKVAVVCLSHLRFGLLFDDIKDVLLVPKSCIHSLHPALLKKDSLISDLIKLDNGRRTLELIDLNRLFGNLNDLEELRGKDWNLRTDQRESEKAYSRYVVFASLGQDYGVPVNQAQEIAFPTAIDDVFKNDSIEGALQLRGQAIPVLSSTRLLQNRADHHEAGENARILVLKSDDFHCGMLVNGICEIISIDHDEIMPLPQNSQKAVNGIYQRPNGKNIMLIQVDELIKDQFKVLRSMARFTSDTPEAMANADRLQSRHLITADCYLIFSITRNFAIELNDVQEIIEPVDLLDLPASTGFHRQVLNLRGRILPVINLREFYGYAKDQKTILDPKLIIARSKGRIIALEVDRILTIYKQVRYHQTPSLNPQLNDKKDTLDRLIEFIGDSGNMEHVLVVNVGAMMDNYLAKRSPVDPLDNKKEKASKENDYSYDCTESPSVQTS
jgi:purine-binding chemotaxis protein CheW